MYCVVDELKNIDGKTFKYYINLYDASNLLINKYIINENENEFFIMREKYGFPYSENEVNDPTILNNFGSFNYLELKYHKDEYCCVIKFYKRLINNKLKIFI